VGITVVVVAAWLGFGSRSASVDDTSAEKLPRSPRYGDRSGAAFTIENAARAGVWGLRSPVMTRFTGRVDRPLNAAEWLANGTIVHASCALVGTSYAVNVDGVWTKWSSFAKLDNGMYVAVAGLAETTEDGQQHLIKCM